jgi:hypothetical protein
MTGQYLVIRQACRWHFTCRYFFSRQARWITALDKQHSGGALFLLVLN